MYANAGCKHTKQLFQNVDRDHMICAERIALHYGIKKRRRAAMDIFSKKDLIRAIYREGGFLRAAKALHIAQPSLSVMVSGIEKEIGGNLFDRSTNPVRLTPLGKKYLECAGSISMIEDDFFNYMNELQGLETGSIALGSNTLYMSNIMPGILSVYSSKHPMIHLSLYEHESRDLIDQLHSGQLELVIDNLPDDDRMERHYLGTEYLLIAVPVDNELNSKLSRYSYTHDDIAAGKHMAGRIRYLDDMRLLNDQPFILLQKGFDTRSRSDNVFDENGITVQSVYELNQLSSAFGIASSGLGLTVVSDTLIRHSLDWANKMQYYTVRSPEFTRDVYYYTMKNRLVTRTIKEFISISRDFHPFSVFDPAKQT